MSINQATNLIQYKNLTEEVQEQHDFSKQHLYLIQNLGNLEFSDFDRDLEKMDFDTNRVYRLKILPDEWYYMEWWFDDMPAMVDVSPAVLQGRYIEEHLSAEKPATLRPATKDETPETVPTDEEPGRVNSDHCSHCNRSCTSEGYDACLGELPRGIVMNACCGHGDISAAHVQLWCYRHNTITGENAMKVMEGLRDGITNPGATEIEIQAVEKGLGFFNANKEFEWFPAETVPTGEELVGWLCGVSDDNLADAKKNALTLTRIRIISSYEPRNNAKYNSNFETYFSAYPVPAEKLRELKNFGGE